MSNFLSADRPLTDREACLVAAYYLSRAGAETTDTTIAAWLADPPKDVWGREFVIRQITVERVAECAKDLASGGLLQNTNDPLLAIETALRFYANPRSWEAVNGDVAPALQDHGAMARNALTVLANQAEDMGI